jgi:hypothetical protein
MSYENFWQDVIDIVYDAVNDKLNTQEEINEIIEDQLDSLVSWTFDLDEVPPEYKMRSKEFLNPVDLFNWIATGPPVSAIWVWIEVDNEETRWYHVLVGPS